MENPFSVLSQDDPKDEGEGNLVEFLRFQGLVPDVQIALKDSNFHTDKYRNSCSLFTCSSKYGYFIAGSLDGFVLGQTENLRTTIYSAERNSSTPFDKLIKVPVKEGSVNIVALTCDNLQLIVAVSGGTLLTYNISDIIKNKQDTLPIQSQKLDEEIIYIQPNPEVYPDVIAVTTRNDKCKLIRYMTSETMAVLSNATSMCWSPKGKQIVCGTRDGKIIAYDMEGNQKDEITPPVDQNSPDIYVNAVVWIETHVFLALYSKSSDGENAHTPYIINRKSEPLEKYLMLAEVNPIFNIECPDSHFYTSIIRDYLPGIKTLIILANSAAGDLATIGQDEEGRWSTWMLDENMPALPLSEDDYADTYPIGLAVDYSATEPLPPFDPAESEAPVPAMPIVFFMTNEGRICSYTVYNSNLAETGKPYPGMVTAQDVNQIPEPAAFPQVPEATATVSASAFNTKTTTTFGGVPSKIPAFSSLSAATLKINRPSASTPTFGSTPSSIPTFGSTSSVGFGSSGFGGSGAGPSQTVSFAALAKSNSTNTSSPGSASSFGFTGTTSATFGQSSGFGQTSSLAKTSSDKPTSAFGQKPTFGQKSSFGESSTFGTQPFGATSFKPSTLDSEKEPVVEEPEDTSDEKTVNAKNAFGLPPSTTKTPDIQEGCSLSFEQVQKVIEEDELKGSSDEESSAHDGKKSKGSFESSLASISDALGDTVESNESNNAYFDNTSTDQNDTEEEITDDETESENELNQEENAYEQERSEQERLEQEKSAQEKSVQEISERERLEEEKLKQERKEEEAEKERKAAEEKRIAEEKLLRIAEERRLEEEKIAEEKRLEEERIAEEQRIEEERLAAIKPDPLFASRERHELSEPTVHERAIGISGIAKEFESIYFDTVENLQSTSIQLTDIEEELYFYGKPSYASKDVLCLEDLEHVWKMSDMVDTSAMMEIINTDAEKTQNDLLLLSDAVSDLIESTDNLKLDQVRSCLETEDKESLKSIKSSLDEDVKKQLSELENKSNSSKDQLAELEKKLNDCKQELNKAKSAQFDQSKLTLYTLRRTMRDIERSLTRANNKISTLEQQELEVRLNNDEPSESIDNKLSQSRVQRGVFLNNIFTSSQKFQPLNA
ncbi:hypothetical protein HPULCUR_005111 [Helicostylum pulchrum]|uniref:Nucleoporin Nup159/Nup146 N-terminal domain-containing protein n=1 Tax=Helicostylum pulchrum TaxID=562976 RepID=A0ABP9XY60_9FUNG